MASSQHFPRPGRPEPVVITEAQPSLAAQYAARKKRYAIMMGIRVLSVILAICLWHVAPLWFVLALAVVGTLIPGFAVVMANDRPPKKRGSLGHYVPNPDRQLGGQRHADHVIDG